MREFIVEVPATIRVAVNAINADAAALVAGKIADNIRLGESLERVGGVWQLVQPEVIPSDADAADVFICSGGKLGYVNADGFVELTGDDCI